MEWISIEKDFPKDDLTVLGINKKLQLTLPIFCYYDEEIKEFFGIDFSPPYPIKITHWTKIVSL